MAQHTFAVGEKLTAANVNTYLMHEGGAWTTWTPAVIQGATPTLTVNSAVYARAGRMITFEVVVTITSTATGGNNIVLTLPVAGASRYGSLAIRFGRGAIIDTSAALSYEGPLVALGTTSVTIKDTNAGIASGMMGGSGFTAALASGDNVLYSGTYEAAT
jgi:hypothetical protein